jgi:hypothetical protein
LPIVTRLEEIQLCLATAAEDLDEIGRRMADPQLIKNHGNIAVQIKGILQNLRDPLDYCACEISESLLGVEPHGKTSFLLNVQHPNDFRARAAVALPGLESKQPELYRAMESCQPYGGAPLKALPSQELSVRKGERRPFQPRAYDEDGWRP